MNRIIKLLFAVCVFSISISSCSKNEDQISENSLKLGIIGKWKYTTYDGNTIPTNEQRVFTYHVDGTYEASICSQDMWLPKQVQNYSVIGNTIVMESKEYGIFFKKDVSGVTKDRLKFSRFESSYDGKVDNTPYEYVLVPNNFSKNIIGFWKGESMDGQQTFGDENHLWEYNSDGTYSYYTKQANGKWLPTDQDNQYVCDGDLLASRWETNGVVNLEWWNVESCDSQKMKWNALRKADDGSTFETNFTFKRISDTDGSIMSPGFIKSQLPGQWKGVYRDGKRLATNDRGNYTFHTDGTGTYFSIILDSWDPEIEFTYGLSRNNIDLNYVNASIVKSKRMKVTLIDSDSLCVESNVSFGDPSSPFPVDSTFIQTYQRVKEDYSLMVIGLWEGVSMTGDDAYDVSVHRWKYNTDGTYVFYNKNGDKWEISEDETSDYQVAGDWIAFRWRTDAKSEMNLERWDIDSCDSDAMHWSAIRDREDGTQYTATVTYKRVVSL